MIRRDGESASDYASALKDLISKKVSYAQVFCEHKTLFQRFDTADRLNRQSLKIQAGTGITVLMDGKWRHFSSSSNEQHLLQHWLSTLLEQKVTLPSFPSVQPLQAESMKWYDLEIEISKLRILQEQWQRIYSVADTIDVNVSTTQFGNRVRSYSLSPRQNGGVEARGRLSSNRLIEASTLENDDALLKNVADTSRNLSRSSSLGSRITPAVFEGAAAAGLFHELIGHAVERDNFTQPQSFLRENEYKLPKIDKEISLRDNPGLQDMVGSSEVDDDGIPTSITSLLEKGNVVTTLSNRRISPAQSGGGSARRSSYRFPSLPRTSNTELIAGSTDEDQLSTSDIRGLLIIHQLGGGSVDNRTGRFSFSAASASFRTPRGELIPLCSVRVFGQALEVLTQVEAVGNKQNSDSATCGKRGQEVLIGLVSPSIRIANLQWTS